MISYKLKFKSGKTFFQKGKPSQGDIITFRQRFLITWEIQCHKTLSN